MSAGQVENYVLLLVLLSVFAGGTLVLLSLLLLFCHRCCKGGRRYSRWVLRLLSDTKCGTGRPGSSANTGGITEVNMIITAVDYSPCEHETESRGRAQRVKLIFLFQSQR